MFLVDATPCGLLSGALGFVRPTFSLTQRLASGDCSGQPGGFEGVLACVDVAPVS